MKICFFGMGSIGQRHLKNLSSICRKRDIPLSVDVFRTTNNQLPDTIRSLIDNEVYTKDNLAENYDIIFITNPTSEHYQTLKDNLNRTNNFFIEKPVFDTSYNLSDLKLLKDGIYYVACPLRYANVIIKLKEMISNGLAPFSIRAICSSYLPDWRPGVDYRKIYSAIKELGGGVSIDLIHELDYLTYLFAFPEEIIRCIGKYSQLEINSDDLAIYICKYKDKIIELHLDYFGRRSKRELELYCVDATILVDILNSRITADDLQINLPEDANDKYIRELEYFINCVENGIKTDNEIHHAQEILRLSREDY